MENRTKPTAENLYMPLNASNLTAIIMKGSPNSSERDAGFCSGSSEGGDDLSMDHARLEPSNPTSPTDSTQDSVDVVSIVRNKRKSSEPAKIVEEAAAAFNVQQKPITTGSISNAHMGPLKKRIRYTSSADSAVALTPPAIVSPPPPVPMPAVSISPLPNSTVTHTPMAMPIATSPTPTPTPPPTCTETVSRATATTTAIATATETTAVKSTEKAPTATQQPQLWNPYHYMPNPAHVFVRHPGVTTLHRALPDESVIEHQQQQQEPLNLVVRKPSANVNNTSISSDISANSDDVYTTIAIANATPPATTAGSPSAAHASNSKSHGQRLLPPPPTQISRPRCASVSTEASLQADDNLADVVTPSTSASANSGSSSHSQSGNSRPQQRNYKNMTRERRIEANARERTRVHTISAAYETLRHAVPSYSNAQKLSKLSVLRIACTYILALSRMAGHDYSQDQSEPSVSECLEALTATIQAEGKIQKKKKDGE